MKNHKSKPTNVFIQAYKNLLSEWRQKRTTLTIVLYHVALIGLFMPTKTFQEFHACQGQCPLHDFSGNIVYGWQLHLNDIHRTTNKITKR